MQNKELNAATIVHVVRTGGISCAFLAGCNFEVVFFLFNFFPSFLESYRDMNSRL